MQVTKVNSTPNFQAKFLHSESLKQIADYAAEHGKFNKLNTARKNIDNAYLQTRLRVDIGENEGKPFISFTRFKPKKTTVVVNSINDLKQDKVTLFKSDKPENVFKFALEKIIKRYKKYLLSQRI